MMSITGNFAGSVGMLNFSSRQRILVTLVGILTLVMFLIHFSLYFPCARLLSTIVSVSFLNRNFCCEERFCMKIENGV